MEKQKSWFKRFGGAIRFFINFVKNPQSVGALLPSSSALTQQMLEGCGDFSQAELIVELGPGTGVLTQKIKAKINEENTEFFAIELNEKFVNELKETCPDVTVYQDSATEIEKYLALCNADQADIIFSGIPWANLPSHTQEEILNAFSHTIKPGGYFISFAYIHAYPFATARNFRAMLCRHFESLEVSRIIWGNVPPALVYTCRKKQDESELKS